MKTSVLVLSVLLSFGMRAQPSEAEIKKQITNAGTKSIKFTKTTGTRQWNKDIGNWEWVRGVEVIRKSELPNIDLIVVGDVVYQYTGAGKYSFWKFRTISNQYVGIPNPSQNDILGIIGTDWAKFYGFYFHKIVKLHSGPDLADNPGWIWHTPNSVEFKMRLKFDHIISYTEIETLETIWNVRLYRDDTKVPWKNFIANMSNNDPDSKKLGVQKYTVEQIKDMEKTTLAFTLAEQIANANSMQLAGVITVPDFNNADEMLRFLHDILRNGDPDKFRAVMLKVLAPGFFVEGSKVQLTPTEERNLADVITAVYNNKVKYRELYCAVPPYKVERWGNSDTRKDITIRSAVDNCNTLFTVDRVNIGYVEGVPVTRLAILSYGIYVRQDQDAINYINSFSDRKKICPND